MYSVFKYLGLNDFTDTNTRLALYYPIMSLVNLFLGVLEKLTEQDDETVTSDLILMDVLAGHFSRLEYATDSMTSITFAREVASLAREARAQERVQPRPSLDDPVVSLEGDGTTDFLVPANADEVSYILHTHKHACTQPPVHFARTEFGP
jgi:hypothetical protein